MEQLNTQDALLWVGVSKNSDPLIRHQEAFMDAFCQYIFSNKVSIIGEWAKTTTES